MGRKQASVVLWSALCCMPLLAACGDDGGGGEAGTSAAKILGDRCAIMQCELGYFCSRKVFPGQCTTNCTIVADCMILYARSVCINKRECGVACSEDLDCPEGADCLESLDGQKACFLAP